MTQNSDAEREHFCNICQTTFQRREHYQRHIRTHTKERPFSCTECKQSFGRVDSLARHYSTLHADPLETEASGQRNERRRVSRACKPCSNSKVRCDGQHPCQRCCQQGVECHYSKNSGKRRLSSRGPARSSKKSVAKASRSDTSIRDDEEYEVDESEPINPPVVPQQPTPSSSVMAAVSTHNPAPVQSMMDPTDLQGSEDPLYHHANMSRSFFGPFFGEPFGPDEWLAVEDFNADLIPTDFAIGVDLGPGPQCDTFAGVLGTQDAQVQAAQRQLPLSPHAEGQADAFESGTHTPSDPDGIRPRKYYASAIEFDAQLIFPDLRKASLADIDDEDFAHVEAIDDTLSKRVFELAESLQNKPSFPRFLDLRPPPASVLNAWVQVYFENFHPIFPFLHKASFVPSKTHWLLMFAVSAIGAHFSKIPDAQACSRAMHEVIRRQTLHLCEIDNSNGRTLWMTQTILLNQIGLMYCGERRGLEIAELYQGLTVTLARRLGLFPRQQAAHRRPPLPSRNTSQSWDHTVMSELRHRTAYATWLVDGALAVDFELSPLMRAAELTIPLPQAESRWESNDAGSWASYSVAAEHGERLTMSDVMSHNDWKAAWQKSGTLGRYAIIQCLSTRSRSETNLSEQFLCDQQISETLTSLLDLVESQETSSSLLDLRALIPHKFMLTMALANADLPPDSLSAILLDSIYGRMFPSAWDEIAQRWLQSPSQGRLAVFYAARTFQLIKASRCAHFSAPVYALRATLILWLYSTIASSCPTLLSAKGSPVLIGHRRLVEMSDVAWIEKGWSRVKLPAIGNLISEQGRYKLLEEATATLHSLRAWGISLTYAELVKRLISATIPHMATNLHKTDD